MSTRQGFVVHLSDLSFADEVLTFEGFVLVYFYLASNSDCQREGVVIEEIAQKYYSKIKIAKLDMEKNPAITSRYRICSAPTLILFQNGGEMDRITGFVSEEDLSHYLDEKIEG